MKVLETERLILRHLTEDDAAFILELLNDPAWLRFIGDRGVRNLADAHAYIARGPAASYERHGFGLYLVEPKGSGAAAGICGLIKRDALEDVDLGFAFLPRFRGLGYAHEAAAATMEYARKVVGLKRVVAITAADNEGSIRLLEKLGMSFEGMLTLPGDDEEIKLYAREF